jgi:hypothetical protein
VRAKDRLHLAVMARENRISAKLTRHERRKQALPLIRKDELGGGDAGRCPRQHGGEGRLAHHERLAAQRAAARALVGRQGGTNPVGRGGMAAS